MFPLMLIPILLKCNKKENGRSGWLFLNGRTEKPVVDGFSVTSVILLHLYVI